MFRHSVNVPMFVFAAMAAMLTPSPSAASVTIVSAYREVVTFASLLVEGDPQGQSRIDELASDELAPFDEAITTALDEAGTFVSSNAWQVSDLGASVLTLNGAFESHAGLGSTGIFAEGFGVTDATIHIQVSASTTAHFLGMLEAAGNGNTHVQLRDAASTVVFGEGGPNGTFPVQESVQLGPGAYVLQLNTGGYGQAFQGQEPSPASGSFSIVVSFGQATSASASVLGRGEIVLRPNPIRESTVIELGQRVPRGAEVFVVDLSGRRVRDLGRASDAAIAWDARDDGGSRLAAGVYFVRVGDAAARAVIVR